MTTWFSAIAMPLCRLSCIALWALALTSCPLFAQSNQPGSPVPQSPDASCETEPRPPAASAVPCACDTGYWIVSSRHARKQIDCGQPIEYEVFRFEASDAGRRSSMDEMFASLQPSVPICIMVHGSFLKWESVLRDSAGTHRWLRASAPCQPMHLILYTWPSNDGDLFPHLKVNLLGHRSSVNGIYLADFVSKIGTDHPVCLIGHSHGTRLVSAALHAMAGGAVSGRKLASGPVPERRLRVILVAAAIDHDWLNPDGRYGCALCPVEALLNVKNHEDFPLTFYQLRMPISKRSLAITGVTRSDRAKMGELEEKIAEYDVSDLIGFGHLWKHYYNEPSIASAIRHYVYFDEVETVPDSNR
jgi:hypothetical protein